MKFVFQLQNFLNLREKLEEQKKLEYGQAMAELEEEIQKKVRLTNEREAQLMFFKESVMVRINPQEFMYYNDYIELLKKKIKSQEKTIENARKKVERKRVELVEAVKERKMLETLREKAHEEYLREEQMAEQKIVDEIVSYRYNARK